MRLDAFAEEACTRREGEVAGQAGPYEMEGIASAPHVLARAADRVLLCRRVVRDRAGPPHAADVGMCVEDAERVLRERGRGAGRAQQGRRQETRSFFATGA